MKSGIWLLSITTMLALAGSAAASGPTRVGVSVGFNLGSPRYYRPAYGPSYGYYRPYPVYVAPRPVIVRPAPVIYEPAPVYIERPVVVQPAPVVRALSPTSGHDVVTASGPIGARQTEIDRYLAQLSHGDDHVRAEAVIALGRLKADPAVDSLARMLESDRSPAVRDSAARALGLICSTRALGSLQHAAQADSDRDVRRSAQFAVDVIRSHAR
jgi:hypothetical protein